MEENSIINKVAESGLITLDLETLYPQGTRAEIDLKDWLYEGIILKESMFREKVKAHDWKLYSNAFVALHCSADAIIPSWAYMLIASELTPFASNIFFGNAALMESYLFLEALKKIDPKEYENERVIIKGCSGKKVPDSAYVDITRILRPYVQSVFYGEACSAVPLYKRKK